jgi:hypothetical protein
MISEIAPYEHDFRDKILLKRDKKLPTWASCRLTKICYIETVFFDNWVGYYKEYCTPLLMVYSLGRGVDNNDNEI